MPDDRPEQGQNRAGPDGDAPNLGVTVEPSDTPGTPDAPDTPGTSGTPGAGQRPVNGQWRPGPWPPAGSWPEAGPLPVNAQWQPGPWPQYGMWSPGQAGAAPFMWPPPYPSAWPYAQPAMPIGFVPWGFSNPPAVAPVLIPPGKFHPPAPRRPILSLLGRASPKLYGIGLAVGGPGLLALLFLLVAPRTGWKLGLAALPAWMLVESVCAVAAAGLIVSAVAQSRQRRADGWQDYAGPSPFLVMAALLAVVTGFGLPIERALTGAGVDTDSGFGTLLLLLVYLVSYVGLVHFLAVRPGVMTWRDIVRPKRLAPDPDDWQSASPVPEFGGPSGLSSSWRRPDSTSPSSRQGGLRSRFTHGRVVDILLPLAMLLPLVLASSIANQALLLVLGLKMRDLTSPLPTSGAGLDPWITLFAVAIVVPIGEEIFFRGFATNAWGRSLGRNSAILRAALFFAFIHVLNVGNTDPGIALRAAVFNFGARVPVAIALTWLYFRRRSILASGTLHASYNGLIQLVSMLTF